MEGKEMEKNGDFNARSSLYLSVCPTTNGIRFNDWNDLLALLSDSFLPIKISYFLSRRDVEKRVRNNGWTRQYKLLERTIVF